MWRLLPGVPVAPPWQLAFPAFIPPLLGTSVWPATLFNARFNLQLQGFFFSLIHLFSLIHFEGPR